MKKRLLATIFVTVLSVVMVFSACTSNTPTESSAPPENTSTVDDTAGEEVPAGEVIELKFSNWTPSNQAICRIEEEAAAQVLEKTNGRIKITCYFSESLLAQPDSYKGVSEGVADISAYIVGITPGVHDLNNIFNSGITGLPDLLSTSKIYQDMLDQMPEFNQEMEATNTRWLSLRSLPATQLHTVKTPVIAPADMKGMKVISSGDAGRIAEGAGAASVAMGPADFYTSLERGVAEAQLSNWAGLMAFKTSELFQYHTHIGEGGIGMRGTGFIINLDTWNKLTPEDQKIVEDAYRWCADEEAKDDAGKLDGLYEEAETTFGATITMLTPEQIEPWADLTKPLIDEWIAKTADKGWPAQEALDLLNKMAAEHQ